MACMNISRMQVIFAGNKCQQQKSYNGDDPFHANTKVMELLYERFSIPHVNF